MKNLLDTMDRTSLFQPFEDIFNKLINEFFATNNKNTLTATAGFPRLDIYIEDDKFVIEAAVAGIPKEDISIEILDRELIISGKSQKLNDNRKIFVKELRKAIFSRRITLPENLIGEPLAHYKEGLLKLEWNLPEVKKSIPKRVVIN